MDEMAQRFVPEKAINTADKNAGQFINGTDD